MNDTQDRCSPIAEGGVQDEEAPFLARRFARSASPQGFDDLLGPIDSRTMPSPSYRIPAYRSTLEAERRRPRIDPRHLIVVVRLTCVLFGCFFAIGRATKAGALLEPKRLRIPHPVSVMIPVRLGSAPPIDIGPFGRFPRLRRRLLLLLCGCRSWRPPLTRLPPRPRRPPHRARPRTRAGPLTPRRPPHPRPLPHRAAPVRLPCRGKMARARSRAAVARLKAAEARSGRDQLARLQWWPSLSVAILGYVAGHQSLRLRVWRKMEVAEAAACCSRMPAGLSDRPQRL